MVTKSPAIWFVIWVLLLPGLSIPAASETFTTFSVPGALSTQPQAINAQGVIAGNYEVSASIFQGFLREEVNGITLTRRFFNDAKNTIVSAMNGKGAVIGSFTDQDDVQHGFIRQPDGHRTILQNPFFPPRFHVPLFPNAINDDGDVCGFFLSIGEVFHVFLRTADGQVSIVDPPGVGVCTGINATGVVAGDTGDQGRQVGFISALDGTFSRIEVLSGDTRTAGINDDGAVAGTYTDTSDNTHGFIRSPSGNITSIDPRNGTQTSSTAINGNGVVIGSYLGIRKIHGFFWRNGAFHTFDPPHSRFTIPLGINKHNVIVGHYTNTSDRIQGFIRTP